MNKKYPSINDKVRVTQSKLLEIKNPLVLANVMDRVGTVVGDHYNGTFDVEFDIGGGFTVEYGYYHDELEVVEVAQCNCNACRMKDAGLAEQQEQTFVAPDGSV